MVTVKNLTRSSGKEPRASRDQSGQQPHGLGLSLSHSECKVSAWAPSTAWMMPRSRKNWSLIYLSQVPSAGKGRIANTPP